MTIDERTARLIATLTRRTRDGAVRWTRAGEDDRPILNRERDGAGGPLGDGYGDGYGDGRGDGSGAGFGYGSGLAADHDRQAFCAAMRLAAGGVIMWTTWRIEGGMSPDLAGVKVVRRLPGDGGEEVVFEADAEDAGDDAEFRLLAGLFDAARRSTTGWDGLIDELEAALAA